jgi:hypothetical protein
MCWMNQDKRVQMCWMTWRAQGLAYVAHHVIRCRLSQETRVYNASRRLGGQWARHVIGCRLTQDPRVTHVFNDAAGNICPPLPPATPCQPLAAGSRQGMESSVSGKWSHRRCRQAPTPARFPQSRCGDPASSGWRRLRAHPRRSPPGTARARCPRAQTPGRRVIKNKHGTKIGAKLSFRVNNHADARTQSVDETSVDWLV